MSILKRVAIIILIMLMILVSGLYYLNKNPIYFPILNIRYTQDLTISGNNASLVFSGYKIRFSSPTLKIIKSQTHIANFSDVTLDINPWLLTSKFFAKIDKSELLLFISEDYAAHNKIIFDGTIKADFLLTKLMNVDIDLISNDGFNDPKSDSLKRIKLQECFISLNYKSKQLSIKEFKLQYDNGIKASLGGDFILSKNSLASANFQAEINDLPIDYLRNLWPEILFPKIHNWVNDHVSEGMINKAEGKFIFTEEDLKTSKPSKESINAEIDISNATVKYIDYYNPIKNVTGKARFDGESFSVTASKANLLSSELRDLELVLLFDEHFNLSLKTKFGGNIANFKEFIPEQVYKKLGRYGINFSDVKGEANGELSLRLPIFDQFLLNKLALDIKADVRDVILDKRGLIKFQKGRVELISDENKISLKVNEAKVFSLSLVQYHDVEQNKENYIEIDSVIEVAEVIKSKILELKSGLLKAKLMVTPEGWQTKIDLTEAEAYLIHLGYTKPIKSSFIVDCSGKIESDQFSSDNCSLNGGQDFSGKLNFSYQLESNQLVSFNADNMKIADNKFSFKIITENNIVNYQLNAKYLDLSNLNISDISLASGDLSSYLFSFKVDNLVCKNNINLSGLNGKVSRYGDDPPDINVSATSGADKFSLTKAIKNGQNIYVLHSKNVSTFSQAFNLYNNIKKGELSIEIYANKTEAGVAYSGTMSLGNFAFTNTSVLSKIILGVLSPLHSLQAVVQSLKGGSLPADSFVANLDYKNGTLDMKDGVINGPSYAIKLYGYVDFPHRKLKFKGIYIPYMYGINRLVSAVPFFGNLIAGGKESALIGANFTIRGSFDNPQTSFNPLSALTPGFLRNIL